MRNGLLYVSFLIVGALTGGLMGCQSGRSAPAPADSWMVTRQMTVRVLRPGVWLYTAWHRLDDGGPPVPANGLLVSDSTGLLLVDTPWDDKNTTKLLRWVPRHLGRSVTSVLVTHSHSDRLGGGRVVKQQGLPLYGNSLTRTLALAQALPVPDSITGLAAHQPVRLGAVEVLYPGRGHAPDNLVVWLPRERILFGGCTVKAGAATDLGNIADADLRAWPSTMAMLRRRYATRAEVVVPGHGAPGDSTLLRHTADLLRQSPSPR